MVNRAVKQNPNYCDGHDLGLSVREAYLDPVRGRVMVSLRAFVEALGGKVDWFPVLPGYRNNEAEVYLNGSLAPYADNVDAWVDASLGQDAWRLYLPSSQSGPVIVPLRQLAMAFGLSLSWDGPGVTANLLSAE